MSNSSRLMLASAALAMALVGSQTASAAWYAKFDGVDGSSKSVVVGEQFDVFVGTDATLSPPGQLGSYSFALAFDDKVQRLAVVDQVFDAGSLTVTTTASGVLVAAAGSGVSGLPVGAYARLTFKAAATGTSVITLTDIDAFNTQTPPQPFQPQAISPNSATAIIAPEPGTVALTLLGASLVLRRRNR